MIRLLDGPAKGEYSVTRAPHFLRAVVARSDGRTDLLDQLHDEPRPIEVVQVYEATGPTFSQEANQLAGVFICVRGPGGGIGGRYQANGEYRHRPDVDGEALRETDAWRAWCRAQVVDRPMYDPTTGVLAQAGEARP